MGHCVQLQCLVDFERLRPMPIQQWAFHSAIGISSCNGYSILQWVFHPICRSSSMDNPSGIVILGYQFMGRLSPEYCYKLPKISWLEYCRRAVDPQGRKTTKRQKPLVGTIRVESSSKAISLWAGCLRNIAISCLRHPDWNIAADP